MTDKQVRDEAMTIFLAGPRDDRERARVGLLPRRPAPRGPRRARGRGRRRARRSRQGQRADARGFPELPSRSPSSRSRCASIRRRTSSRAARRGRHLRGAELPKNQLVTDQHHRDAAAARRSSPSRCASTPALHARAREATDQRAVPAVRGGAARLHRQPLRVDGGPPRRRHDRRPRAARAPARGARVAIRIRSSPCDRRAGCPWSAEPPTPSGRRATEATRRPKRRANCSDESGLEVHDRDVGGVRPRRHGRRVRAEAKVDRPSISAPNADWPEAFIATKLPV